MTTIGLLAVPYGSTHAVADQATCAAWNWPNPDARYVGRAAAVGMDGEGGGEVILEKGKRRSDGRNVVWGHFPPNGVGHRDVWMDVSFNGGATWIQCGPFGGAGSENLDTKFHVTSPSPSWKMRACGKNARHRLRCTAWY
ncbi:hypothetical protein DP939_43970 [Spongiactinospora rosea]|uniref:Uncharacterized protein n=1 Tax=Spongiactinospora rosea TaxID=2248750 RepID=A0A366LIT4_9ACTN|nr:hypothetical protein [Spongiactinospora rosea]RBQ13797.1 hypothetical protein DP939_43970 [Spongiactinospora rosea]